MKSLFIASDHAGLDLKTYLQKIAPELPWVDLGTHSKDSVDYPDFANALAEKMIAPDTFGVLVCGSGQGMAIRANRFKHIRAALCWSVEVALLARAHNNANVLCLGGRLLDFNLCKEILLTFISTPFEGGRHSLRVEKL